MIYDVSGDILKSRAQAIAHGVAADDDFKNGLALALREAWPGMARDFRHWCHESHPKPGDVWLWGGPGGVRIVNLLTQEAPDHRHGHPGKAHLEYVNHALRALHKLIETEGLTSVALPRLATGVGGLDWNDVKPLVERHLGSLNIPIYVYSDYRKDVEADEPELAAALA